MKRQPSSLAKKIAAYKRGQRGEAIAAFYLRLKGYRILAHRYKTPVGEIDLVAASRSRIAFVEVKSRRHKLDLEWSVGARQQHRIRRAALYWLARHQTGNEQFCLDVILLGPRQFPTHLVNAFPHIL